MLSGRLRRFYSSKKKTKSSLFLSRLTTLNSRDEYSCDAPSLVEVPVGCNGRHIFHIQIIVQLDRGGTCPFRSRCSLNNPLGMSLIAEVTRLVAFEPIR
ncbi:hypothetical protein CEXT_538651 [Caerostris extrusa]|uniref:Uncharacterized protein n=1 Tax=Caerostris extrusa TaxID=172846 RepID=A0AAV4Y436_CAEEX|nr:hypothetical protein CEXT_538651 [Caerostris extrusa]